MAITTPEQIAESLGQAQSPQFTSEQIDAARNEIEERTGISTEQIDEAMIQRYLQLWEDIRSRLDLLNIRSTENMRERIWAFHALLEEYSTDIPDVQAQLREQAEEAANRASETAREQATTYVREQVTWGIDSWIERNIPESVRNIFWWIANIWDKVWTWVIWLFSGTFLGKLFRTEESENNEEDPVDSDAEEWWPEDEAEDNDTPDEEIWESDETQNIPRRMLFYKTVWQQFMRQISGEIIPRNTAYRNIVQRLENKAYWEIQNTFRDFLSQNWDTNILREFLSDSEDIHLFRDMDDTIIKTVFQMIGGINAYTVVQERLWWSKYKDLANRDNFREYFWEEVQSRILNSNSLQELQYQDISLLVWYSLPPTLISWLQWTLWNINGMIFWDEDNLSSLFLSDSQERRDELMPEELLSRIVVDWWSVQSPEDLRLLLSYDNLDEAEQEYVDRLIDFENHITQTIVQESRFNLWTTDFENLFTSSLSYREVVYLYLLLNGNSHIESIWEFESSLIYFWIYGVLNKNHTRQAAGSYLGSLTRMVLNEDDDRITDVQRSLIYKNLGRAWDEAIRVSMNIVWEFRHWAREYWRQQIADALGVSPEMIPSEALDIIEIAAIVSLLGSNIVISRLPLPMHVKVLLSITLWGAWIPLLISFLYDRGVFTRLLRQAWEYTYIDQLNDLLERETWHSLRDLAEFEENNIPFGDIPTN